MLRHPWLPWKTLWVPTISELYVCFSQGCRKMVILPRKDAANKKLVEEHCFKVSHIICKAYEASSISNICRCMTMYFQECKYESTLANFSLVFVLKFETDFFCEEKRRIFSVADCSHTWAQGGWGMGGWGVGGLKTTLLSLKIRNKDPYNWLFEFFLPKNSLIRVKNNWGFFLIFGQFFEAEFFNFAMIKNMWKIERNLWPSPPPP